MVGAGQHWSERMGVSTKGAVLIRPDGFGVFATHSQRAHHGSVSKEQRAIVEEDLKSGRLKAVVATSSSGMASPP